MRTLLQGALCYRWSYAFIISPVSWRTRNDFALTPQDRGWMAQHKNAEARATKNNDRNKPTRERQPQQQHDGKRNKNHTIKNKPQGCRSTTTRLQFIIHERKTQQHRVQNCTQTKPYKYDLWKRIHEIKKRCANSNVNQMPNVDLQNQILNNNLRTKEIYIWRRANKVKSLSNCAPTCTRCSIYNIYSICSMCHTWRTCRF